MANAAWLQLIESLLSIQTMMCQVSQVPAHLLKWDRQDMKMEMDQAL